MALPRQVTLNMYPQQMIFNHLLPEIKSMSNNTKSFKLMLTTFLLQNSFYTIEEFFELKYD
jgi:hypothetical protein